VDDWRFDLPGTSRGVYRDRSPWGGRRLRSKLIQSVTAIPRPELRIYLRCGRRHPQIWRRKALCRGAQHRRADTREERRCKMEMVIMEERMKERRSNKLKEIIKIEQGLCEAHILLGHVYSRTARSTRRCKEFEYVIKCDPTSNDAKVGLGMAAPARRVETDKALEYFQAALSSTPSPRRSTTEMARRTRRRTISESRRELQTRAQAALRRPVGA